MSHDRRQSGAGQRRFSAVLFDFGGTLDAGGESAVGQFRRGDQADGGTRTDGDFEAVFHESDIVRLTYCDGWSVWSCRTWHCADGRWKLISTCSAKGALPSAAMRQRLSPIYRARTIACSCRVTNIGRTPCGVAFVTGSRQR